MIVDWHILKIGQCQQQKFMAIKGGEMCKTNFPALVGLIIHNSFGPILFDTGYDKEFFKATQKFPEKLYRLMLPVEFGENDEISHNLGKFGLKIEDINGVIISHFHGDHIAGLKNFPNAKIFCAKAGLINIKSQSRLSGTTHGLISNLLPDDITKRSEFFEDFQRISLSKNFTPFEYGVDILGDKSLIAVELKGHCAGHFGLIMNIKNQKPVFFIGDAAWSIEAVMKNIPPPRITTDLLSNTKIYRKTLSNLNSLYKNNDEIEIIPSHCEATQNKWVKND